MSKSNTETMFFSITGEFVTKMARDWLYAEKRPYGKVLDFLLSCMAGTDLDNETLIKYANDVLSGKKKMIGNTRDDTFCMVDDDTDVIKEYSIYFTNNSTKEYSKKTDDEEDSNRVSHFVRENKDRFFKTTIHEIKEKLDDYGWLSPGGKFFPVGWGEHESWALSYINKNYRNDEITYAGDFLVEKGWILLHSPAQMTPHISTLDIQSATKRQKEFLYDYFMQRNMTMEANEIWKEEYENYI